MNDFITTLAWVFGILATILTIARIHGFWSYSEFQKMQDELEGIRRNFPIIKSGTIMIVCWAWIISQ